MNSITGCVDDFLISHQYNLLKVSDSEKEFVKKNRTTFLDLLDFSDCVNTVLRFPGFCFIDHDFLQSYFLKIYKPLYSNVFTPPRGFIDKSTIIIVGISPGDSLHSFSESAWEYGPSSKYLHHILNFSHFWYFSNICKEPFPQNHYNEQLIERNWKSAIKEFSFFKNHKFILLGNYPIYNDLIKEVDILKFLRIKHPSYFVYRGDSKIGETQESVRRFALTP
jgi:hypothetical protein